jgi:hypothetical protein
MPVDAPKKEAGSSWKDLGKDLKDALAQAAESEKNKSWKDQILEGTLEQAALGAGAVVGCLNLLEQGLPFKDQLKDGYDLLRRPSEVFERDRKRSDAFNAFVSSVWTDPQGTCRRMIRSTRDFLTRQSVSFLKSSRTERAATLGRWAPSIALILMGDSLDGVQGATMPYGFSSARKFGQMTGLILDAAKDEGALAGMRGSAATGIRFRGGKFCWESDFDFFVVSDKLYQKGLESGAKAKRGAFYVGTTKRYFPEMHAVEGMLRKQLSRKSWIRIFSHKGFETFFKTGKEIIRP